MRYRVQASLAVDHAVVCDHLTVISLQTTSAESFLQFVVDQANNRGSERFSVVKPYFIALEAAILYKSYVEHDLCGLTHGQSGLDLEVVLFNGHV